MTNAPGTSQIILFTSTSASHTFTWFSENGQLPIARPWTHTPTPSWNHWCTRRTTGVKKEDGHLTRYPKEASLDASLTTAD